MKASLSRTRVLLALVLCALCLGAPAFAQEKKEAKQEGKKEDAAEPLSVRLNASVFDAEGRPVNDLRMEDFEVLEDGVPQKLTHFERREGPLTFGLVVDNSGTFRSIFNEVVGLGSMFVAESGPDSEAFVVRFVSSDQITIMQNVTASKPRLAAALGQMYIEGGQTAIMDAVYLSAEHLLKFKAGQTAPRRYGLVLITDGEDRANFYRPEQVYQKLREAGAPLYVAGVVKRQNMKISPEKARKYLERFAFESGGRAHFADQPRDLAPAVRQILDELGAPYALGYASTNPKRDGRQRKLEVRARGPAGPLAVRAKADYTAPDKK
jgi:Ca-activated chloride channel homolog